MRKFSLKQWTLVFVIFVILLITGWDVFVWIRGGTESTISALLIDWSYKYPFTVFLMGFVCGHLYWRMSKVKSLDGE